MVSHSKKDLSWFVNDAIKKKAFYKNKLHRKEASLEKYFEMCNFRNPRHLKDMKRILKDIIQLHKDYLDGYVNTPSTSSYNDRVDIIGIKTIFESIVLEKKKRQMSQAKLSIKGYLTTVNFYYHLLYYIEEFEKKGQFNENAFELADLNILTNEKAPYGWLLSLIQISNNYQKDTFELFTLYFKTMNKDIEKWKKIYLDKSFVHVFNAIFYLKIHPQMLFDEKLPAEKLISVSSRLEYIYHLIEFIQSEMNSGYYKQTKEEIRDLLFHGDDLPKGIIIDITRPDKVSIKQAVKRIKIDKATNNNNEILHFKLQDIYCAYKFWFNPSRLVDAVMTIHLTIMNSCLTQQFEENKFRKRMLALYKHLSTTECLDMYGYFSNKDTRYLLRTFYQISYDIISFPWMKSLQASEKAALKGVFQGLKGLMEALRDELAERKISTNEYPFDLAKPANNPSQRIKEAVWHVAHLYGRASLEENPFIEELFYLIENDDV